MSKSSSWGVVAQVSDPLPLAVAFIAHHLELGAQEIHLFLDTDQPELEEFCKQDERIQTYRTPLKYWQEMHGRRAIPKKKTFRQGLNASWAASRASCDWLFNIDVDEFVWADADALHSLGSVPEDVDYLRIPNLERAYLASAPRVTIWDGVFKRKCKPVSAADRLPLTEFGFFGYHVGKTLVRTKRDLHLSLHRARIGDRDAFRFAKEQSATGIELLHYDGMTPFHWAAKLIRRAAKGVEFAQTTNVRMRLLQLVEFAIRADDIVALKSYALDLQSLSNEAQSEMEAEGALFAASIDPASSAMRLFGPHWDWSVSAFDAAVLRMTSDDFKGVQQLGGEWRELHQALYSDLEGTLAR